jgi:chemotaxis protein CheX
MVEVSKLEVYTVKCRYPDVGIIRNALEDIARVHVIEPELLKGADPPPDLIFFGWGKNEIDYSMEDEAEARIRHLATTCILLRNLRNAVAFRDVPILAVVEQKDAEDAVFSTQFGSSGFIVASLEEKEIRRVVNEAMRPVGNQANIDVRLVNPFVNATLLVLEQLAGLKAVKKDVHLKRDYHLFGEISALIGITGQGIEGSVALTFQDRLAHQIVSKMWEKNPEEISREDLHDGLGELVNVICGKATTELSQDKELNFNLALPTIVSGYGHQISQSESVPCLVIVFEAAGKSFAVQVAIRSEVFSQSSPS